MSDWTGAIYGFYTNKPIDNVLSLLKNEAGKIGYQWEYNVYGGEESLLFYRNKKMLDYHLKHGYNTDINDQGCFCVEAKATELYGMASLFEFDGQINFTPYDINLLFNKIFYYRLVIPDFIEKSAFSKNIHQIFVNTIKHSTE